MPDLIPATPEVLIVHPHGLAILNDLLKRDGDIDRLRVSLPPALPAFVGHSRLLLN